MVPGIGEKRRKELLKQFGSLKKMKEAKIEELEKIVVKMWLKTYMIIFMGINKKLSKTFNM